MVPIIIIITFYQHYWSTQRITIFKKALPLNNINLPPNFGLSLQQNEFIKVRIAHLRFTKLQMNTAAIFCICHIDQSLLHGNVEPKWQINWAYVLYV